jgi:hypothetical protein
MPHFEGPADQGECATHHTQTMPGERGQTQRHCAGCIISEPEKAMNAKLINVTGSAQRGFLVAAAFLLHHVATAVPASSLSDLGIVILNAEDRLGDAVSVKAKMASLSGFSGAGLSTLGAPSAVTAGGRIVYLYAGGYTGDFISIGGGGGGGGFTPVTAGSGGGFSMTPAGTPPSFASGLVISNPSGNSPAAVPLSSVSAATIPGAAGAQPVGLSSSPGSVPTSLTGAAESGGGLAVLPAPPLVVAIAGTPANNPSSPATLPTGSSGATLPPSASVPGTVGVAVVSAPAPAGTTAPVASPFATPVVMASVAAPSAAVLVPDGGVTFLLFSLGLAIVLGVRGRFLAFAD